MAFIRTAQSKEGGSSIETEVTMTAGQKSGDIFLSHRLMTDVDQARHTYGIASDTSVKSVDETWLSAT